jgi:hypothetical protein
MDFGQQEIKIALDILAMDKINPYK